MTTNFTWTITQMQVKPQEEGFTDVVIIANWQCSGQQDDPVGGAASFGSCEFPLPEGTFTPYADLTQEQVLGWCWSNGVNQTDVEAQVQAKIDALLNPPVINPPLPWVPQPTPPSA